MVTLRKLRLVWKHRWEVRAAVGRQVSLLEGDGVAEALGSLTAEELDGLRKWMAGVPAGGVVVEVGTLFGLTTIDLARRAPTGVKILTVDNFSWNPFGLPPKHHEAFTRRILAPWIEEGRIELIHADSDDYRARFKALDASRNQKAPHMVFFDADHSYEAVRDEIAWAKALGVKTICGHDYGNPLFGVTRAVDEAFPGGVETAGMCWKGAL